MVKDYDRTPNAKPIYVPKPVFRGVALMAVVSAAMGCSAIKKGTSQLDRTVRNVVEGEPESPEKPKAFTRKERLIGDVTLVNASGKFVLFQAPRGTMLPQSVELYTTGANGRRTSKLRLSPEQKSTYFVADLIQGNPQIGDQVMMEGIIDGDGKLIWGAPSMEDASEDEIQTLE